MKTTKIKFDEKPIFLFYLLCLLLDNIVLEQHWLDKLLVLLAQLADNGGEDLANISDDGESERNSNNGEEDTKETAWEGDRCNVPVAYGGQDGGGEED